MPFRLSPPRDRKLYRLVKKAETVHLVKGRSLYVAGDPARDVFLVRTGFMRLVLPGMEPGRAERTVAVALPWEVFGDEALTEGRRRYGAVAGSACTVNALPKVDVLRGLKTAKSSLDAYLEGQEQELHRLRHAQGGSRGPNTGPTARRGAHRHRQTLRRAHGAWYPPLRKAHSSGAGGSRWCTSGDGHDVAQRLVVRRGSR